MEIVMSALGYTGWVETPRSGRRDGAGMVPMMVMMPEPQPAPGMAAVRLDGLYDEAMSRFDAFCFWHGRPPRSARGMREVAQRLEAYGSPPALRIAEDIRVALEEAGA